ncbi:protein LYK5 [Sesamum alatum]|uniref:Protein LYK5 n=1 Tax=Sesamum alatum TaxID=300844 RepID=A0AAE1YEQ0_9LAMI|nr:protein LYK5 [Sesamum alatum]
MPSLCLHHPFPLPYFPPSRLPARTTFQIPGSSPCDLVLLLSASPPPRVSLLPPKLGQSGDAVRPFSNWFVSSEGVRSVTETLTVYKFEDGITYLVYEYAKKGSLSEWLCPAKDSRVQVAYDVADALNYLHNFTNPPYIHKNLKSNNILLDGNLRRKANFRLARILDLDDQTVMTSYVVGTYGYIVPKYIENGLVTLNLMFLHLGCIHGVLGGENVRENLHVLMDSWLGEEYPLERAY